MLLLLEIASMDSKRRRVVGAAAPQTSLRALHRVREMLLQQVREEPSYIDSGDDSTTVLSFIRDVFDVKTPYGDVVRKVRIDGTEIDICHPVCIFWHFANISADFATMCGECCTSVNKIAVWCDEVVSGNVLRPDTRNKHAVFSGHLCLGLLT